MASGTSFQSPTILGQSGIGWLLPSLAAANAATYSQVGNIITVTSTAHLIPLITHDNKEVYLQPLTGALTKGWYTSLKVINANSFQCVSPISQTASGNLTTMTGVEIQVPDFITIPGHSMGANGQVVLNDEFIYNNSATAKTRFIRVNGVLGVSAGRTTSSHDNATYRVKNKNSEVINTFVSFSESAAAGSNVIININMDTSIDQFAVWSLQLAAASEFIALESIQGVLYPSS